MEDTASDNRTYQDESCYKSDSYCDWQSDCTTDSYISNKDDRTTDGYICNKDDSATGGYICNKDDRTIDGNADSSSYHTQDSFSKSSKVDGNILQNDHTVDDSTAKDLDNFTGNTKRVSKKIRQLSSECDICGRKMLASSVARHKKTCHDQNLTSLKATCVDPVRGIFLVNKTTTGRQDPLHVIKKTWGNNRQVVCESKECEDVRNVAIRSGQVAWECSHICAVRICTPYKPQKLLSTSKLEELVTDHHIMKQETAELCEDLQHQAVEQNAAVIVPMALKENTSCRYMFFSVYVGKTHHWSVCQRVVTKYDSDDGKLYCNCCTLKRSCVHKNVTVWYLYQQNPEMLQEKPVETNTWSTCQDCCTSSQVEMHHASHGESEVKSTDNKLTYPPEGELLVSMTNYIYETKRLVPEDSVLHQGERSSTWKLHYFPQEKVCHYCKVPLSSPHLVTNRARIVCRSSVVEGNSRTGDSDPVKKG